MKKAALKSLLVVATCLLLAAWAGYSVITAGSRRPVTTPPQDRAATDRPEVIEDREPEEKISDASREALRDLLDQPSSD